MKTILFSCIALFTICGLLQAEKNDDKQELQWRDFINIGIEGKGWNDTHTPYTRLPSRLKSSVTEKVWEHSLTPTGLYITFETDSSDIYIKREFDGEMTRFIHCSFAGFDLYGKDGNTFKWLATSSNRATEHDFQHIFKTNGKKCVYRIYLPLRNTIKSLKLGLVKGSQFKAIAQEGKPIVFYGTSIVHGAYASHSGISHPSLIGRRLNIPIVNLGFSGAAQMELKMADILAEIDAAAYVIDAQPNMNAKMLEQRCEKFLRRLRQLRHDTPILLVEVASSNRDWYYGKPDAWRESSWRVQRAIYQKLMAQGEKKISYLRGENLYGNSGEESIDDCHPGDLGFLSMADKMTPLLKQLLQK